MYIPICNYVQSSLFMYVGYTLDIIALCTEVLIERGCGRETDKARGAAECLALSGLETTSEFNNSP